MTLFFYDVYKAKNLQALTQACEKKGKKEAQIISDLKNLNDNMKPSAKALKSTVYVLEKMWQAHNPDQEMESESSGKKEKSTSSGQGGTAKRSKKTHATQAVQGKA